MQLYINEQAVDLTDDTPIALTFQINNLAEVKNQQGNTSNQFKLPLTQRNRTILGFADEVAFCGDEPYQQLTARLIQDGIEIIPYGIAEINSIEQDTANVTVLSGNVDFFDAIDAKIYDMGDSTTITGATLPFAPYNHEWTLNNVVASQAKTDGWIWPVVDYGKIGDDTTVPIDVRYLRPGFFLKTAIDTIITNAGYKAAGSLLADPLYQNLIVQFANDSLDHSTDVQQIDPYSMAVQTPAAQTISYLTKPAPFNGTLPFQQVITDPSHAFDLGSNTFIAPTDMDASVEFDYSIQFTSAQKKDIDKSSIEIFFQIAGPGYDTFSRLVNNTHGTDLGVNQFKSYPNQKLTLDISFKKGQRLIVGYIFNKVGGTAIIAKGATFKVTNKQKDVLYKQQIQCERIFPDISQKDLLKDTLQRFGVICQTDNSTKTVTFATFKDIVYNIPKANDWTAKCIDQGKTISFQLGGYAQANNLKYKADDNVVPAGFADSMIKVADATLPATTDLFESQFAPSLNRPWINGTIAVIDKVDQSDSNNTDFSISTQPRILTDQKMPVNNLTFTDGTDSRVLNNDVVSIPYFDKPGGGQSLLFESLRLKYYPELERILQNTKKVVRLFLLTPRDIAELDLLIPVYLQQDGAYYYINKIDAWQKGKPTKVELVKLG